MMNYLVKIYHFEIYAYDIGFKNDELFYKKVQSENESIFLKYLCDYIINNYDGIERKKKNVPI